MTRLKIFMLNKNQKLGRLGEDLAVEYLLKNKYKIIQQNYKNNYGEIDIIAKLKNKYIFIEVKTRSSRAFGLPEDAVNNVKQQKLLKATEKYIIDNKINGEVQIDVIAIETIGDQYEIRHLKDSVRYF